MPGRYVSLDLFDYIICAVLIHLFISLLNSQGAKIFSQRPDFREKLSIDRVSWESMKKAGADQQDIWGDRIYNKQP
jgi:hypothetical protein